MEHPTEIAILDKMLEPVARCLTPEIAKQISELRADAPTQARIDELAAKCHEGELVIAVNTATSNKSIYPFQPSTSSMSLPASMAVMTTPPISPEPVPL